MRRPTIAVPVEVLRARHLDRGLWCDRCALPSRVTVEVLLLLGHRTTRYAVLDVCTDCRQARR